MFFVDLEIWELKEYVNNKLNIGFKLFCLCIMVCRRRLD